MCENTPPEVKEPTQIFSDLLNQDKRYEQYTVNRHVTWLIGSKNEPMLNYRLHGEIIAHRV